jgi:threonine aldolase
MAARLAAGIAGIDGIEITAPVEANAVFARLPRRVVDAVQPQFPFYLWDESDAANPVARWMCSFDLTEQDVDDFVDALRAAV